MAFSVAYNDLLDKNIRHIYSSLPANVRFRCDPESGVNLAPHHGCVTPSNKRRTAVKVMPPSLYRRLWAYSPQYGCPLPRNPALRSVSPTTAQHIVTRVSQRTTPTHGQRRYSGHHHHDDDDDDDDDTDDDDYEPATHDSRTGGGSARCSSRSAGSTRSAEKETVERMMRPTVAWSIRSDLREGSDLDPVKVVSLRVGGAGRRRGRRQPAAKSAHL